MGRTLSMNARREITKKLAGEYGKASRKAKWVILDQLVATTGWSKVNARRALTAAGNRKGPATAAKCTPRRATYGYETVKLDCHGVFGQWALLKWGCYCPKAPWQ